MDNFLGKKTKKTTAPKKIEVTGGEKKKELKCDSKKCGFKRKIRKQFLDEGDLICSKCGGSMHEVKQHSKQETDSESEEEEQNDN
jgi:hypothetical protein